MLAGFFLSCKYIDLETLARVDEHYEPIFAMLNTMEQKAESFYGEAVG